MASIFLYTHALKREAALVLKDSPDIIVQRTLTGRYHPIPIAYADKIKDIRGVLSVTSRLWGYYYDGNFLANYSLVVPEESPPPAGSIVIGSGISKIREAFPGDTIGFTGFDGKPQSYTVQGTIPEASQLVAADLILITEKDYRALSGLPSSHATDLVLKVRNQKELTIIAEKITKILPDTRPIIRNEILRTYDAVFSWRSGVVVIVFSIAALAFAIFAWDKATGLSAEERKEIGILKAVGWESSDILLMKFWEGLVISLTAFLLGTLLGYLHVFFGSSLLFVPVLKGWSTLYPQFRLVPFVNFGHLAIIFFLTVVPYTVTTIIPAWRVATIDPDTVLR